MRVRRKRAPMRRSGIGLPALLCVLSAAALLLYAKAGGEQEVRALLSRLASNPRFVLSTMAFETGIYPDPTAVASTEVHSPFAAATEHEDDDENIDAPATGESGYAPTTPTETPTIGDGKPAHSVTINNATSLSYDINAMLASPETLRVQGDGPQVMIVHTHSTESYKPDDANRYTPSETDRTLDTRYNVVRVGDEIAKVLESRGVKTVHCREIFDNPAYNGSYDRSLKAIEAQLAKTPSIQIVIDVHRDSIVKEDGTMYKTSCTVNGKSMAQVMLVVGTNAGGLKHDEWRRNLNYAVNLQSHILAKYPTLMRPVNLRKQRFNQSARSPGSMLIEVGSSGNTLTEAIDAATLFAQCLADDLTGTSA